jgi:selenide,water dikinase
MLHSNRDAAHIFSQHGANACTDVTGFGLAGHLAEILKSSDRCAELKLDKLPIMDGVQECLERGIRSSLYPSNRKAESVIFDADKPTEAGSAELHKNYPSLFDPQTCGGLLACVPEDQATSSVSALHAAGYKGAVIIGNVLIDTPNEFGECIYLS